MSGSKGQQVNMGEEIEKALIYSLTRDARADNVRLLNAALRAAKVEELERVQSRFRNDGIALTLIYLQYRIAELERAAQIEEGE